MWTRRQFLNLSLSAAGMSTVSAANNRGAPYKFGVIADPQYADAPPLMGRYYRESLRKLSACIDELNQHDLEFTVTLGDLIDRDFSSFDPVLECYEKLKSEHRLVLGNHDFSVADGDKGKVLKKLGLERGYDSYRGSGWRTVILDGTEVSTYRYAKGDEWDAQCKEMFGAQKQAGASWARPYSGALHETQLKWLESELKAADEAGERVIVCNHFPVLPAENPHNLWNADAVVEMIRRYPNAALYLNGHNHAGNYAHDKHCHYVNLKGMVETETDSAFAVVTCYDDHITVEGFGSEPNRPDLR